MSLASPASTARETLLEAAHAAVGTQPWAGVRMVDVARAAGVSRQTLYNEFGTKEGLGAALVDRLVDAFVEGAVRVAAERGRDGADTAVCCAAAAAWMLRTARAEPIVRAALTGHWGAAMPLPSQDVNGAAGNGTSGTAGNGTPGATGNGTPGRGRETAAVASLRHGRPVALTQTLCARMRDRLAAEGRGGRLELACETGVRIALSFVVAPPSERPEEEAAAQIRDVVRALLAQR